MAFIFAAFNGVLVPQVIFSELPKDPHTAAAFSVALFVYPVALYTFRLYGGRFYSRFVYTGSLCARFGCTCHFRLYREGYSLSSVCSKSARSRFSCRLISSLISFASCSRYSGLSIPLSI